MDEMEIFKRQTDWIKPEEIGKLKISLVGCGSTGTATALNLIKTGFTKFNLYDFDLVELHNLSNQLHSKEFIGKEKTESLEALMRSQSPLDLTIQRYGNAFDGVETGENIIVVICVDSMKARREIFNQIKSGRSKLVIDIRVGAFDFSIYAFNPQEISKVDEYSKSLEGKGSRLMCHARSYMISSMIASSFGCQLIFDFLRKNSLQEWKIIGNVENGKTTIESNLSLEKKTQEQSKFFDMNEEESCDIAEQPPTMKVIKEAVEG